MSEYPVWWNTTVTLYNKYEDKTTHAVTWFRTVLHNCFWKFTGNKVTVGNVTIDTDSSVCRVPQNSKFKERFEWEQLSAQEKSQYFTFGMGDIIVRGVVDDDIDEYSKGKRSTDLLNRYNQLQGCIIVHKMSDNTGIGRGIPHYSVRGV